MKDLMISCINRMEVAGPETDHRCLTEDSATQSIADGRGYKSRATGLCSTLNELQMGQVLDGRFRILGVVNRGGMAWIYEALDLQSGQNLPHLKFI